MDVDPLLRVASNRPTGPRTAEGKAISSRNALKHGLTAKSVVIFDEDVTVYEAFREGFVERLSPADAVEAFLVDRVVACAWRLRRAVRVERELFEDYESLKNRRHVSQPMSVAHAMIVDTSGIHAFAQVTRHEAAIERSMLRALHELQRLQAAREGLEVPVPIAVEVNVSSDRT